MGYDGVGDVVEAGVGGGGEGLFEVYEAETGCCDEAVTMLVGDGVGRCCRLTVPVWRILG